MSKYLLVYQGTTDPSWQPRPEQGEAMMQAWTSWGAKVGSALSDFGAPTAPEPEWAGPATRCRSPATSWSRRQPRRRRVLCDGHPFLDEAPADFSVDVYELTPM